jgi:TPR repeat protein
MKQAGYIMPFLFLAFFVAVANAQGFLSPPPPPPPAPTLPRQQLPSPSGYGFNDEFFIPPMELAELERKALDGDGESAERIARYFDFYVLDHKSARYWMQISAEDDYGLGQFNFAYMLDSSNSPPQGEDKEAVKLDRERACFWLKKAIGNRVKVEDIYSRFKSHCKL